MSDQLGPIPVGALTIGEEAILRAWAKSYAERKVATERQRLSDMLHNMAAISWAEWDEKAGPIDQGKALALEHVAALLYQGSAVAALVELPVRPVGGKESC